MLCPSVFLLEICKIAKALLQTTVNMFRDRQSFHLRCSAVNIVLKIDYGEFYTHTVQKRMHIQEGGKTWFSRLLYTRFE